MHRSGKSALQQTSSELLPWLRLCRATTLAYGARRKLADYLRGVSQDSVAVGAGLEGYFARTPGLDASALRRISPSVLERDLAWLSNARHALIPLCDRRYPDLLREIPDPPLVLFVRGDAALLAAPQVALVGSRNPTPAGQELARNLAARLVEQGIVVTSGLAIGIDRAAHLGALDAGGRTVAVTATGPDAVYPYSNRELAERIASEGGALVSEFPTGVPPRRDHFPRRNRIISGLCRGTAVVEAAARSGSLITARWAAEQGRDVFAVPGPVGSPLARGCHALIRQGATLVESAEQIIEELGWPTATQQVGEDTCTDIVRPKGSEATLLALIGYAPVTLDELIEHSGLTPDAVSSMLLALELRGWLTGLPGGRYQRKG